MKTILRQSGESDISCKLKTFLRLFLTLFYDFFFKLKASHKGGKGYGRVCT